MSDETFVELHDLIPVSEVACVLYATSAAHAYDLRVDVLHDGDGFHVGLAFHDQNGVRWAPALAEEVGIALIQAAAQARARDERRGRLN